MAQHDLDIDDGNGQAVLQDLNENFEALATNNSGTAAPSVTFPYMWWVDSDDGLLKIRNGANNGWIETPFSITTSNAFQGNVTFPLDVTLSNGDLTLGAGAIESAGDIESTGGDIFTANSIGAGGPASVGVIGNFRTASTSGNCIRLNPTSGSYADNVLEMYTARGSNSAFQFIECQAVGNPKFQVAGDGEVYADGSYQSPAADYAEMFEWADGNLKAEDRVGRTVILDGDKIKLAGPHDIPFGVVSAQPLIRGNNPATWAGQHLRDSFGRLVLDALGSPIESEEFDSTQEYLKRSDRQEWSAIGLVGRLRILKGQPTDPRWIMLRELSDDIEEWLIR